MQYCKYLLSYTLNSMENEIYDAIQPIANKCHMKVESSQADINAYSCDGPSVIEYECFVNHPTNEVVPWSEETIKSITEVEPIVKEVCRKYGYDAEVDYSKLSKSFDSKLIIILRIIPYTFSKAELEFRAFLNKHQYDEEYGFHSSMLFQSFEFGDNELLFQIVGAEPDGKDILCLVNGDLYPMTAEFVAAGCEGDLQCLYLDRTKKFVEEWDYTKREWSHFHKFRKSTVEATIGAKNWKWAIENFPEFEFQAKDLRKSVRLYGKQYTICGFFDRKPYKYVVVKRNNEYFKVYAYLVQHALGRFIKDDAAMRDEMMGEPIPVRNDNYGKTKYCVTVVRTGCVFVSANSEAEAMDIANHQTTDMVTWSEDWNATDCCEDDSEPDGSYITEKAFE